jgi:hypothetical protein
MIEIKNVITETQRRMDDFCQISTATGGSIENVNRDNIEEQRRQCVTIANSTIPHGQKCRYLGHMIQKTQSKMHRSSYW